MNDINLLNTNKEALQQFRMSNTLNFRRKISLGDQSEWKPTGTASSVFSARLSGAPVNKMIGNIQHMESSENNYILRHENDMLGNRRSPQKRSASNAVRLFRPFDTPPKKIMKLSIDANNNMDQLADTDVEPKGMNSFTDTLQMDASGSFEHNVRIFSSSDDGFLQIGNKFLTPYNSDHETPRRDSFIPSTCAENFHNSTQKILNRHNKKSTVTPSIFRTIDLLAHPSQSTGSAVPIQLSVQQRFGYEPDFCKSTPLVRQQKFQPSSLSSKGQSLTFDLDENFQDHPQDFGTPANIFSSKPSPSFPVLDTPPHTPSSIIRPSPCYLFRQQHLSLPKVEENNPPFSGNFQVNENLNDHMYRNIHSQFSIGGSNQLHRDFRTDYKHFSLYVPETTNEQLSYMDFRTSGPTDEKMWRPSVMTSAVNFHQINQKVIDCIDVVKVKQVSTIASSNPDGNHEETAHKILFCATKLDARFECNVCQKTFYLQRLLDRHVKRHTGVKGFICSFCSKGFCDAFDLKRHVRIHTGVRPFKCEDCGKAFTQRGSLELHTSKVHKRQLGYAFKQRRNKVYVCEQCGHSEEQQTDLKIHIRINHPRQPSIQDIRVNYPGQTSI